MSFNYTRLFVLFPLAFQAFQRTDDVETSPIIPIIMSSTSPRLRHRPSSPYHRSSWPAPAPSRTSPHSAGALQLRAVIAFAVSAALIGLVGVYVGVVKLPMIGEDQKHDEVGLRGVVQCMDAINLILASHAISIYRHYLCSPPYPTIFHIVSSTLFHCSYQSPRISLSPTG